jgi:hypothetical protein
MEAPKAKWGALPFPLAFFMYLAYWKVVQEKDKKPILTESSGTLGVLEGLVVSGVRCRQY